MLVVGSVRLSLLARLSIVSASRESTPTPTILGKRARLMEVNVADVDVAFHYHRRCHEHYRRHGHTTATEIATAAATTMARTLLSFGSMFHLLASSLFAINTKPKTLNPKP